MKVLRVLSMVTLIFALGVSTSACKKVSDADLQKAAQTILAENPDAAEVAVAVSDRIATLTGTVKDDATKAAVETALAAVKELKSIDNKLEVIPPVPEVDYEALDAAINAGLADALKDHKGIAATVDKGIITITGEIKKANLPTLMEKLNALNPERVINDATVK